MLKANKRDIDRKTPLLCMGDAPLDGTASPGETLANTTVSGTNNRGHRASLGRCVPGPLFLQPR